MHAMDQSDVTHAHITLLKMKHSIPAENSSDLMQMHSQSFSTLRCTVAVPET